MNEGYKIKKEVKNIIAFLNIQQALRLNEYNFKTKKNGTKVA
jgi:hypothetical protein